MFSILGVCNGNFTAAAREYALGYPFRRHPNKNVSVRLNQLLRETGNIAQMIDNHDKGRPRTTRTSRVEEQVIDIFENQPRRSTRAVAQDVGIHFTSVLKFLQNSKL